VTRISIVILQSLLLFGLGEAGARLAERVRKPEGGVTFDYAPYRMLRMVSAPWSLNREGFRARELETYRNTFLVEFLGASVCLGVGTNPGAIVPDRVERLLHEAGMTEASVLNLCQGGSTSAQELAIFLEYGLPLSPQVVLSFNGANDLMHPRPVGEDDAANLPYRNRDITAHFDGHHLFADHLALIRISGRVAGRLLPDGVVRASAAGVPPKTILNSYLYSTDVVRTLTEAQGGWYAVLFQPTLHYEKPWSGEERRMWSARRPGDGAAISRYVSELYGSTAAALGEWSQETGAGFFDLSGAFARTTETVYSDSVHFTGECGYETLERELVRQGLIEKIGERYRLWERSRHVRGPAWPH
jgi:hypothetical protein